MPEFVTLTLRWQIMTGASPLLLINSSSLSMSVSLIWIDGLHDQSWNSLPVIELRLQNKVIVYGWNTQEMMTSFCLRKRSSFLTSFWLCLHLSLSTYVAYYVEFCQSDENLKFILVWIMFVLCDRHMGINQYYMFSIKLHLHTGLWHSRPFANSGGMWP